MATPFEAVTAGLALGLAAGLTPGPLLALAAGESIRHGPRAGVLVSFAPLITDAPIVAIVLLLVTHFGDQADFVATISTAGGAYLLLLAWHTWHGNVGLPGETPARGRSLSRGILTNLLNPNLYLHWLTVGAAFLLDQLKTGPGTAGLWLVSFYAALIASMATLAVIAGSSRHVLRENALRLLVRAAALALAFFGARFLYRGLTTFTA